MPRSLPAPDPHRLDRILDARTRQLAMRQGGAAASGPAPIPVLACALGNETYGLPLAAIAQVVPATPLTPTPGAPPAMLGLLGRNGQVFIVLDLALALGAAAAPASQHAGHLLLLRHGPRRFALRVDRATGAIDALPAEAPAEAAPHRAVTGHALAPGGALLGLIDLERLLRPYLAPTATVAPSLSSTNGSVTP